MRAIATAAAIVLLASHAGADTIISVVAVGGSFADGTTWAAGAGNIVFDTPGAHVGDGGADFHTLELSFVVHADSPVESDVFSLSRVDITGTGVVMLTRTVEGLGGEGWLGSDSLVLDAFSSDDAVSSLTFNSPATDYIVRATFSLTAVDLSGPDAAAVREVAYAVPAPGGVVALLGAGGVALRRRRR